MSGAAPGTNRLSDGLRDVRVAVREDLEVSRHVFRGAVSYVVRDPMSFQSQRLDEGDYALMAAIRPDRSLSATVTELTTCGILEAGQEEHFYQFVLSLHRLGFLRLPISDDKAMYRRYKLRRQAEFRQKLMGFLFLKVPLWNPDAFLNRTRSTGGVLFRGWFFVLWILLIAAATCVAALRWHDLRAPFDGVLLARNLPLLWLTLIVLKAVHEFGHAYACKHYGGHVPEMGLYLIAFTPCAYVDASACWGFVSKKQRVFVCLAGMYVESIFAALAVFVWALTEPSLIHSVAYNVIFLAGIVTILFNINPLMRCDGYYILGDLLEIPNLRGRAHHFLMNLAKRLILGVCPPAEPGNRRLKFVLLSYGVCAAIYRMALLISIAALLAAKVFLLGLLFALVYLGVSVVGSLRRLMQYLWHSPETQMVRGRAIAVGVLLLVVAPALVLFAPIPSSVYADAVVCAEREAIVRAATPGFLRSVYLKHYDRVEQGASVAELENVDVHQSLAQHVSDLRASQLLRDAYRVLDPVRGVEEELRLPALEQAAGFARENVDRLTPRAPFAGRVMGTVDGTQAGRFLKIGDPLALIVTGPFMVRAILPEAQLARMSAREGDAVLFRTPTAPGRELGGVVVRIAPAGSRTVAHASITQLGGGDTIVDPRTMQSDKAHFEVLIQLEPDAEQFVRYGAGGTVRISAHTETLGKGMIRRALRFWSQLYQ